MLLTVELPPAAEKALRENAAAEGVSAEKYAAQLLERDIEQALAVDDRPIWDPIVDNMKDVPPEEFEKLPTGGANQVNQYQYGHPKR